MEAYYTYEHLFLYLVLVFLLRNYSIYLHLECLP
jgi:hypothetical protein